jgi:hypothetical protein
LGKKRCTKCLEVKEHSEFNKRTGTKDGLQYYCKQCNKKYVKARYDRTNNKRISEALANAAEDNPEIYNGIGPG